MLRIYFVDLTLLVLCAQVRCKRLTNPLSHDITLEDIISRSVGVQAQCVLRVPLHGCFLGHGKLHY